MCRLTDRLRVQDKGSPFVIAFRLITLARAQVVAAYFFITNHVLAFRTRNLEINWVYIPYGIQVFMSCLILNQIVTLEIIPGTQKSSVVILHFLKVYLIEFNTCRFNPMTGFQLVDNYSDSFGIIIKNIANIKYCCNGSWALDPNPD